MRPKALLGVHQYPKAVMKLVGRAAIAFCLGILARHFYTAVIKFILLDASSKMRLHMAFHLGSDGWICMVSFMQAPTAAYGFRITVQKWLILVRLLLGEIPERTEFEQEGLKDQLKPYLQLTQTVRIGDLNAFK